MTTTAQSKTSVSAEIRKLMDDQAMAVRAKDVEKSISNYAPNIVSFDVVDSLRRIGIEACRKRAEEWFSSFKGPIDYQLRDVSVTASDEVAFACSLNRVIGTKTDGEEIEMWWRATACFHKVDGRWLITHEHSSVPFDMSNGKAMLDLKP
jgi:uncharacterized protein (TIGR02246 family)